MLGDILCDRLQFHIDRGCKSRVCQFDSVALVCNSLQLQMYGCRGCCPESSKRWRNILPISRHLSDREHTESVDFLAHTVTASGCRQQTQEHYCGNRPRRHIKYYV